jgi:Ca-activated chloride channel family protein
MLFGRATSPASFFLALPVSRFDHCLVNKHDRDVIFYRVDAAALRAFKPRAVGLQLDFDLAGRARKYLQQPFAYCHLSPPVLKRKSLTPGSDDRQFLPLCDKLKTGIHAHATWSKIVKTSFAFKAAAGLLAAVLLISPALAQNDQVIKLKTDLITIDATVTDKDGNFIRNLKAEDFVVYEDGEPQKLEFFDASEQAAMTRPLAVVIAIDTSGSIKPEEIAKQREATESFIKLVRPESVFAVIAFNSEIRVLQDFTSDPKKISQAFQKIGEVTGSSRIFGSIDRAVSMLKRAPRYRKGRRLRRVAIVLTDGYDNIAPPSQDDLIRRANEAEVTVYSITLQFMPGMGSEKRLMTLLDVSRIVPLTGGADFSADMGDFSPVFKAIAEEIRSSYTLAYYPSEKSRRDGREHQVRVECRKSGAIIRASRTSYQLATK